MNEVRGFTVSIVIVIIAFLVSAITAGILADLAGVWKKPFIGSSAAFFVVLTGYATAPSHKQIASITWLVVGAIAAWILAGNSYYPEDYTQAYQPTLIPLFATYLSGLIALLICMVWHKKYSKKINLGT
ncbi:hypothetical protein CXF85_21265 [Colwellia sp. 75C3]|uniref:hypothetical protein n=1 Tax=Colwellia sp. 75C3 TaxID=888425 RepID=UPI000C33B3E5|nr:hypothetical protein [Colwellia sp. 75C3]PKG80654.1 hypothetical protein CXF85_21265 [Colwellia sp. 75C3]